VRKFCIIGVSQEAMTEGLAGLGIVFPVAPGDMLDKRCGRTAASRLKGVVCHVGDFVVVGGKHFCGDWRYSGKKCGRKGIVGRSDSRRGILGGSYLDIVRRNCGRTMIGSF